MSNWPPIETAPKDGTEILIWVERPHRYRAAWWDERYGAYVDTWMCYEDATHWQPLPDPPTGTERGLQS